ncbi:hypothetical protein ACFL27_16050 [candidate division CSSED10-310 bacterium]|uniref:Uncharacterized protein n=1 Tax=candidate division CSSED10-310 bacterium TaxID=2855610 RepID=A0ABV6YZS7_UNCC1
MVLCGKCGLFKKYENDDNFEGICVWFDLKIPSGEAYTKRECEDYVNWLPDVSIVKLKIEKTKIYDSYQNSRQARFVSICSLIISIIAISISVWANFWR